MGTGLTSPILRQIRRIVEDDGTRQRSDQDLLAAFANRRDEAAFHALVHRHGPMVLDVCRSVLANEADLRATGTKFVPAAQEGAQSASARYRAQLNKDGSPSETIAAGYCWTPGTELANHPLVAEGRRIQ